MLLESCRLKVERVGLVGCWVLGVGCWVLGVGWWVLSMDVGVGVGVGALTAP